MLVNVFCLENHNVLVPSSSNILVNALRNFERVFG